MKQSIAALSLLVLVAPLSRADVVWIVPDPLPNPHAFARMFISSRPDPDATRPPVRIGRADVFTRDASGRVAPLRWNELETVRLLTAPGKGPRMVAAVCTHGVAEADNRPPRLVRTYAKTHVGYDHSQPPPANFFEPCPELVLEIVPLRSREAAYASFVVLWHGAPLPEAEVAMFVPSEETPVVCKTDAYGRFILVVRAGVSGCHGIRVRHVEPASGVDEGKPYKETEHQATLVVQLATDHAKPEAVAGSPPAATGRQAANVASPGVGTERGNTGNGKQPAGNGPGPVPELSPPTAPESGVQQPATPAPTLSHWERAKGEGRSQRCRPCLVTDAD